MTHLFATLNKAEKGTVSLDEEQGEVFSVQGHDVKCTTELRKHAVTQVHPSHAAEGVRWKGGRRVAVMRQEQLGVSSSGAKDLPQGLAEGTFASSDRTRRWTCLLRAQHKHGRSAKTPTVTGSTRHAAPVNQFEHVCVEECPLTMRHTAKRIVDSCGESHRASAGVHPGRPKLGKPNHGNEPRSPHTQTLR